MSSSKANIVFGEAPESGSEEEIDLSESHDAKKDTVKGSIVAGEAPESDDDNDRHTGSLESISSALSVSSLPSLTGSNRTTSRTHNYPSLLNKKLFERNMSLYKNINDFAHQAVSVAGKELNTTNQLLLRCQLQLQEAAGILQNVNGSIDQCAVKLNSVLVTDFIPEINLS